MFFLNDDISASVGNSFRQRALGCTTVDARQVTGFDEFFSEVVKPNLKKNKIE